MRTVDHWDRSIATREVRYWAAGIQLSDDEFWILGGFNGQISRNLNSTEICSPTSSCRDFVDLPEITDDNPQVVRVNGSHIFVMPNDQGRAWMFNQDDNTFHRLPDMMEARWTAVAGLINEREIVVAGGYLSKTSEILDLDKNEWREGPDLPVATEIYAPRSVQFEDSFVIVGGTGNNNGKGILKFNARNYTWEVLPHHFQKARYDGAAFLVPDDYI